MSYILVSCKLSKTQVFEPSNVWKKWKYNLFRNIYIYIYIYICINTGYNLES